MKKIWLPPVVYELLLLLTYAPLRFFLKDWAGTDTLSAALSAALVLLLFLPGYLRDREGERREKGQRVRGKGPKLKPIGRLLLCLAGGAGGSALSVRIMESLHLYERFSNQAQAQLMAAPLWLQLPALVLLVPLGEELIFRGLVYRRLKEYMSPPAAALVSAALFALGHGNMLQILYAFPSALLLCLCMEFTGNLSGPVAFHIGANLLTVLQAA